MISHSADTSQPSRPVSDVPASLLSNCTLHWLSCYTLTIHLISFIRLRPLRSRRCSHRRPSWRQAPAPALVLSCDLCSWSLSLAALAHPSLPYCARIWLIQAIGANMSYSFLLLIPFVQLCPSLLLFLLFLHVWPELAFESLPHACHSELLVPLSLTLYLLLLFPVDSAGPPRGTSSSCREKTTRLPSHVRWRRHWPWRPLWSWCSLKESRLAALRSPKLASRPVPSAIPLLPTPSFPPKPTTWTRSSLIDQYEESMDG